jgi:glycosyltransferase involved in cell wall biosynthesis
MVGINFMYESLIRNKTGVKRVAHLVPSTAPTVRILGTHGVPAAYGGFETAAENVALYLRRIGWRVVVYCQVSGDDSLNIDMWRDLERVKIPEKRDDWLGTASFDMKSIRHALGENQGNDVWLTFGYNTGIFDLAPRIHGIPNLINMDGMEWTRARWGWARQAILLANERAAGLVGNLLVADHPEIARYLSRHFGRKRVVTIAYGAHEVKSAPEEEVRSLNLSPGRYAMVVCRPIPENSILEIVKAWSHRRRGMPLVVVGSYTDQDPYHRDVWEASSEEVLYPGAIFQPERLSALRHHAALYLHGHTVGGTNPSLVEAMAAGNAVVAHNNVYNRWVAGQDNAFFTGPDDLVAILDQVLPDEDRRRSMGESSRRRFSQEFTWEKIGSQYDQALRSCLASSKLRAGRVVRGD